MIAADWHIDEGGGPTLHVSGDWTSLALGDAAGRLGAQPAGSLDVQRLDLSALGRIDTAGALLLLRSMAPDADIDFGEREDLQRLIDLPLNKIRPVRLASLVFWDFSSASAVR